VIGEGGGGGGEEEDPGSMEDISSTARSLATTGQYLRPPIRAGNSSSAPSISPLSISSAFALDLTSPDYIRCWIRSRERERERDLRIYVISTL
jgi:hypothetical protein